ncbi:hypothetical protein B0181_11490 [Moraxella caviae]|uniref:Uncharacterized protein n=1 Tax=Moraxella caviae TaxID=34060 RepID=A0A1S9ZTF4_9GAMM|nr:hypothetical protein [Moraxella caviae]OOR86738.1 hypothetical protein B0181_11490 [Moraxella caviae]STZ14037.1 Uncharacterised protein [Moraxella caviae]VEW12827.1 Uncharacterised protein [Moraxella caviae]
MSFFAGIKAKWNAKMDKVLKIGDFDKQLTEIIADGVVTNNELETIKRLIQEYGLTEKDLNIVGVKAFRAAFKAMMSDNIITQQEESDLLAIKDILCVQNELVTKEMAVLLEHQELRNIQNGILPVIETGGILLQRDEQVHFLLDCSLREERVVRRSYQGGSQGVSVRVAKGVSFRVGQHKGRMVSERDVVVVDTGNLAVTNKRIMFLGSQKSFDVIYKQLIGYQVYSNGLDVHTSTGKTRQIIFDNKQFKADVLQLILDRVTIQ